MKEDNHKSAKSNDSRIKKDNSYKLWAVGLTLLVLIIIFYHRIYFTGDFPITTLEELAQLGDSYGMWSSLFSGLAFAGVVATFVMQRKTLDAQMEELELARNEYKRQGDELAGQKNVMAAQLNAVQLQQFEGTFFRLLDEYRRFKCSAELNMGDSRKIMLESHLNTEPLEHIVVKEQSVDMNDSVFYGYVARVAALIRFTYFGYVDVESESVKTYFDLLFSEFSRKEALWLVIILTYCSDDSDFDVILKSGFIKKYKIDDTVFNNFSTCSSDSEYFRISSLYVFIRRELFVESDRNLKEIYEVVNDRIKVMTSEFSKLEDDKKRNSDLLDDFNECAKVFFDCSIADLHKKLNSSNYYNDFKNKDDLDTLFLPSDFKNLSSNVEFEIFYAILCGNINETERSLSKVERVLDQWNSLSKDLNDVLL